MRVLKNTVLEGFTVSVVIICTNVDVLSHLRRRYIFELEYLAFGGVLAGDGSHTSLIMLGALHTVCDVNAVAHPDKKLNVLGVRDILIFYSVEHMHRILKSKARISHRKGGLGACRRCAYNERGCGDKKRYSNYESY